MPYKCTACNKSFRYKISQRTHKCTAQPPGIVVRTQGYLVHRLQAAMNKVAENTENKNTEKEINVAQDSSVTKSKISVNSLNQSFDDKSVPLNETCTSSAPIQDNDAKENDKLFISSDISKTKADKPPQIYLLVKGPNGETYYQPLILSQNLVTPPIAHNNAVVNVDTIKDSNHTDNTPSENTTHTSDLSNISHEDLSDKSIAETIAEISNLFGPKSSPKGESDIENEKNLEKELSATEVKADEIEDSVKCNSKSNIEGTFKCETAKTNINSDITNSSSIMSELFDSLMYVNNNENQSVESLNEAKGLQNNCRIHSDSNPDSVMDSSDLISLMLSPTLSSPSDRFGQLSLSPNSSINTSLTSDNYGNPSFFNSSLSNSDVPQDTFFENLTDDTLKELLFGGVK